MSDKAKLSILGMYRYAPNIFDGLQLPVGADKQTLINTIVFSYSDLTIVYPNAPILEIVIRTWSSKHQESWQRIWDALKAEYNPIENYNRHEDIKDSEDTLISHTAQDSGTISSVGNTTSKGTGNNTNKATSFDSNTLSTTDSSDQTDETIANTTGATDTVNDHTETSDHKKNYTHLNHTHGNIGVTTNQQMIDAELQLRNNTFYDIVANEFKEEFLIQIY